MQPNENDYDPEPAFNPFDLWKGADFKLKIKQVAGFWNYDDSSFTTPSTLGAFDDAKLEEVYNQAYDLNDFTAPSEFKTYEELEARLKVVLGAAPKPVDRETVETELEDLSEGLGNTVQPKEEWTSAVDNVKTGTEDDDALSYFAKLAEE